MVDISTNFGGLLLKNPIIIASAPPTAKVENILRCADAGAGGIVTKTIVDYDTSKYPVKGRRTFVDKSGIWAYGTFSNEILTLQNGINLIKSATKLCQIPIIASVGSLTLSVDDILNTCLHLQDAGAKMIHLDLFYVPQPRATSENVDKLLNIFAKLTEKLNIPFAPKLNTDIPVYLAAEIFRKANLQTVFLLDSIKTPIPIDIYRKGQSKLLNLNGVYECSLFGEWQKPITLQYTSVLFRELKQSICAGGGLVNGLDVIEAMMFGASAVQFATPVIKNGYTFITRTLEQIQNFLIENNYSKISEIHGMAFKSVNSKNEYFNDVKAFINQELCINCKKCKSLVFCNAIRENKEGKIYIDKSCNGCALCQNLCPISNAIKLQ